MRHLKKNQKEKSYLVNHIWKIIAIACLIIFSMVVIAGILKAIKFHSEFRVIENEKKDIALQIAIKDMQQRKENVSYYSILIPDKTRNIDKNQISLVPVNFKNNTESHFYLIDVQSKEIISRSDTYYYKQFRFFEKRYPPYQIDSRIPFEKRR